MSVSEELLFEAAKSGDMSAVEDALASGLDVNARDPGDNASAMHWAAAAGHIDIVRRLADAGGDVIGSGDDHALEVIGWATCAEHCHEAVADFLLGRGARHHIFSAIAMCDQAAVRSIASAEPGALCRRMSRSEDHQLPLHFAVRRARPEMVALLVELGADPLGVDICGHNAAAYATAPDVDRPVMEAIHALTAGEVESAGRGSRKPRLGTPDLLAALALREWDTAALAPIEPGALHVMAKRGDAPAVAWLIANGAEPDALWRHWDAELTALHLAAAHGHREVAEVLLGAGADTAVRDSLYDSDALGWARYFRQPEILEMLETATTAEDVTVVLEFREDGAHVREIIEAFDDGWTAGITAQSGVVRLHLDTPGETWGAAVMLVEDRLDRLAFDWRSHACCRRP